MIGVLVGGSVGTWADSAVRGRRGLLGLAHEAVADVEAGEAIKRFARLSIAEQDAIMARGRRIEALNDLEGLPEADVARLRPVIETQIAVP
jgi:hypothetical protein